MLPNALLAAFWTIGVTAGLWLLFLAWNWLLDAFLWWLARILAPRTGE